LTNSALTLYPIKLRPDMNSRQPDRPSISTAKPQARAVSSANPSPLSTQTNRLAEVEQPLLKSHRSFASLRETQESSSSDSKGFAKFLAGKKADWRGGQKVDEVPAPQPKAELGEGKEVERNGKGIWTRFILHANGGGVAMADDAVEVFYSKQGG
jgi:hypothetical protein